MSKPFLKASLFYCSSAIVNIVSAQGLTIKSGANVVVNGGAAIVIENGGIRNDGSFNAGTGSVVFSGSTLPTAAAIAGTTPISFYRLNINKPSGGIRLSQKALVLNSILLSGGIFDLSGFDLNLGNTGNIIGENETAYITGPLGGGVVRQVNLNAPHKLNPGNIGIEITSDANAGLTTIRRSHQQPQTASGYGINRYYDIVAENNSNLNATVKIYYLDHELSGLQENELNIWSADDNGNNWTLDGRDASDINTNFVVKSNIGSFDRFTLGSNVNHTLPVSLLYFTGALVNSKSALNWATTNETANSHFELERSANGRNFTVIARIAGAGTSSAAQSYTYADAESFSGVMFYRLKQVDANNSSRYSNVISLYNGEIANKVMQVYPNPTSGPLNISFSSDRNKTVILQITNQSGATISTKTVTAVKGLNQASAQISTPSKGIYYLQVIGIENRAILINKQ